MKFDLTIDSVVFDESTDPEEFEKHKKIQKIQEKHYLDLGKILAESNLNKKSLERYVLLMLTNIAQQDSSILKNNLDYREFSEGLRIVNERFGFDNKWLICMSLIQLQENLIKKKLNDLKSSLKGDESIYHLI